jgi:hypothetical protein
VAISNDVQKKYLCVHNITVVQINNNQSTHHVNVHRGDREEGIGQVLEVGWSIHPATSCNGATTSSQPLSLVLATT